MAAAIAQAMGADTLLILSNVPGLLKNPDDPDSLIKEITLNEIDSVLEQYAQGRMKKKVLGAKEALDNGVQKVIFASASVKNPVTKALNGNGTVFRHS
jgi:acetylglutamate/LysW-gamma-L-alpha-aminoadipate kinase